MEKFKKCAFGGYNRTEVDAKIWELEKRAERFEKDHGELEAARAGQEAALQQQKLLAAQKEQEITALKQEIERLNSELEKSSRDDASAAIGGVYLKAYESGTQIIDFSRRETGAFLDDVEGVAVVAQTQFEAARRDFSEISDSVDALIEQINSEAARLRQRVTELTGKASRVFDTYNDARKIRRSVDDEIRAAAERYTAAAGQYLNLPGFSEPVKATSDEKQQPPDVPSPVSSEVSGSTSAADTKNAADASCSNGQSAQEPLLHVL